MHASRMDRRLHNSKLRPSTSELHVDNTHPWQPHLLCFRAMAQRTETLLDASGLTCPMPLLKAKQALNGMQPGMMLRVIATDPGSVRDFEVFSAQSGNALLESRQEDGSYFYLLQKKGG